MVHHDRVVAGRPLDGQRRPGIPAWIPSLDDALGACSVGTVNVELKVPRGSTPAEAAQLGEALAGSLARHGGSLGLSRLVLSSFSAPAARAAREAVPALRVGLLLEGPIGAEEGGPGAAGFWALHVHHEALSPGDVAALHVQGLQVVAWSVNEPAEMERLAAAGVDVLITDTPTAAVAVLGLRPGSEDAADRD